MKSTDVMKLVYLTQQLNEHTIAANYSTEGQAYHMNLMRVRLAEIDAIMNPRVVVAWDEKLEKLVIEADEARK